MTRRSNRHPFDLSMGAAIYLRELVDDDLHQTDLTDEEQDMAHGIVRRLDNMIKGE